MKYTYAYKTSDGIRHEDSIDSSSREEVFNVLRAKGIKAIKVVAADGSKANGEVVVRGIRKRVMALSVFGTAIFAGLASYFLAQYPTSPTPSTEKTIVFTTDDSRIAFSNLQAKATAIVSAHSEAIESLEFDLLTNYQFIENTTDTSILIAKIKAGYKAVDTSRSETRDLFKSIFTIFPADCVTERTEAQRLYAQTMDALDLSENRIVNDEKAFKLLEANRGKWHSKKGKVVWTDATLANEFEYFRRDVSPSAVRWRKDFNVIETNIVEVSKGK